MPKPRISLYDMQREIMLILECPSGVVYENQVGGNSCSQEEIEGVLAPIGFEPEDAAMIMNLPFRSSATLDAEIADMIDAVLSAMPFASYLKVDRSRLKQSCEAWIFVVAETPEGTVRVLTGPYFGAPRGFGPTRGVLTWPNSD